MPRTVVALYDTEAPARQAADELEDHGFQSVFLETHGAGDSSFRREGEDLMHALRDAGAPQDEAEFYSEGVRRGGSLLVVEAPDEFSEEAARVMNDHEPVEREQREPQWREQGYTGYDVDSDPVPEERAKKERERYGSEGEEEARVTGAHEEVHVGKREVEGGGTRIHKGVRERPVEETVVLHEEQVDVDREPASEETSTEDAFKEETIEMTERREEPVVEKETHMDEEVVARKKSRERSETIHETVRETTIDVERFDDEFDDETYRRHYNDSYSDTDYGYNEYEPAYRFGAAYGAHEDYSGYDYKEVEPELRRHYEKEHGEGTFERVKDAVRHAYQRVRS